MVKVIATQDCFPDNRLRKAGEVFDYDGVISPGGPLARVGEEPPPPKPRPRGRAKRGYAEAPEWTTEGHPDTAKDPV